MRTLLKSAALAGTAFLAIGLATPAQAAPGEHGNGVGGCIDQMYGNATNARPSGHGVLPSQSPGPWLNTTPRTWGPTVGSLIQAYGGNPGQLRGTCTPS